ncbi:FAD:protein FMN transferase [Leucobacter weissii]|uniref:FAD:protein FMN transferase n=1 Tax=Leucobacter weissii TaxID=1983706 RepID=A0A939MLE4_9MICO|nr:FAD:protein FMN transferase [Leucobacter weissii]
MPTIAPDIDLSFDAIGVPWRVEAWGPLAPGAGSAVRDRIDRFDRAWSRFRDDSLVAEASREAGRTEFPAEGRRLFALYRALYEATEGAVTPFVGDALAALGYGPAGADGPGAPPPWERVARIDGSAVDTSAPVTIDVGAAGKGLLVDLVGDVLAEAGATASVVDASGDLRIRGSAGQPVRIALEHPYNTRRAIGVVEVSEGAVCASAGNRRTWGDGLHHVLDGRSGRPVRTVVATWALAEEAMLADGAATALFFLSPAELLERFGVHGARMSSDGLVERTSAFPGEVFA